MLSAIVSVLGKVGILQVLFLTHFLFFLLVQLFAAGTSSREGKINKKLSPMNKLSTNVSSNRWKLDQS